MYCYALLRAVFTLVQSIFELCTYIAMSAASSSTLGQTFPGPAKPKAATTAVEPETPPPKRAKQLPPCDSEFAKVQSGSFQWLETESVMFEWNVDDLPQLIDPNRFEHGREKCESLAELLNIAYSLLFKGL